MTHAKQTKKCVVPPSCDTLTAVLETLPGALFFVDNAATIVYANAGAQSVTGITIEDLRGRSFWRCVPQLVSSSLYRAMIKAKKTRELTEVQYVSPVTQTWLHVYLSPMPEGLTLLFHEMREPDLPQQTFVQSKHLCMDIVDGLQGGIGLLTSGGIVLEVNEAALEEAHVRCEDVIGKPLAETPWWSFSPAGQEQVNRAITQACTGETVRFETQVYFREEMPLSLRATVIPHMNADHHIEYLVVAWIELTVNKRAESDVLVLIDAIPQLVWTGRPDGYVDSYNQRWLDYTGMSMEEAQGDGWMLCTHPDDRQRVLAVWQQAVQTGEPYEVEQRLRDSKSGEYRWFLMQATPFKDAQGTIIKYIGTCADIDKQKRAEQRLRSSEENWRVLAEAVPQIVWTTRADAHLDYCNQRYCEYTHTTFEQIAGQGWRQLLHPDDAERVIARRQHSVDTGEPFESEHRLRNGQTGEYRWFLVRALPVRDETGQVVKWFGTSTDIHEEKQAAEDIRVLIDAIPQFVWIMRPDGACEYCNKRWCDYTGMTAEQAQGEGWMQCVHVDDRQHVLTVWQQAIQTGRPCEIEERMRDSATGEYRWFLIRAMPYKDERGTIVKWFGTSTDIDDRKQAEQRIKESRESWRVLAETVPQLVWTTSPDGLVDYWSQRWYAYSDNYVDSSIDKSIDSSPERGLGNEWGQFLHPDDYQRAFAAWHRALETGEPYGNEYRLRNGQTGEYRWFLVRGTPVRDEVGQIVKWFGTCTDIEDQKRIEQELRQSQERANVLMNSNIIGITVIEGDQIVDANDTFLGMTGYTREDLLLGSMNWKQMTPEEYLEPTQQAHRRLAARQSMTPYEKEYVCKDGSRLPVLVGEVVLKRHPFQVINFVLDNSARKELEQRKDAFIGMVSHELKTPLTALKLQASLLQRQLAKQHFQTSVPALFRMEAQLNKIARLVEELLDVSKIQAGRLEYLQEQVDLDELLREVIETMQQTCTTHTLVVRGAVQTSLIGDRDRLGQVFTNLMSNAIKYSPEARTVEVDLSATAETIVIRVHDHGLGVPREQCDKIFERFYRATGSSQRTIPGLGIGLYIVAEIVKRHGGTITVESVVGEGSTFTVTLPRNEIAEGGSATKVNTTEV